jgi:hypothetical protein
MEYSSQIGRWSIRFDPELTRELYAKTAGISCECADCLNFRAAGDLAFSPAFIHLLRQLGVEPGKPAELCHCGNSGESMPTQGWFHIVGFLESGRDAWQQTGENTHSLDPEPFPGIKSIGLTARLSQVPKPFEGLPLVQLEFETTVPWVTAAPLA